MDAYIDGCRATWISTAHPTRKSRRSSSHHTNLAPRNASGSEAHSKLLTAELGKDVQIRFS